MKPRKIWVVGIAVVIFCLLDATNWWLNSYFNGAAYQEDFPWLFEQGLILVSFSAFVVPGLLCGWLAPRLSIVYTLAACILGWTIMSSLNQGISFFGNFPLVFLVVAVLAALAGERLGQRRYLQRLAR